MNSTEADLVDALGGQLPRLQRIARLLTGSAEAAEELVAEAVASTLPRWRDGAVEDLPAYLRRSVVNLAARRWRRRAVARRADHAALDWLPRPEPADAEVVERDRTVRAVLRLPPRRRAVVVLRYTTTCRWMESPKSWTSASAR